MRLVLRHSIISLGKWFMCAWKECWVECSINASQIKLTDKIFKPFASLHIFCLLVLSIFERRVLISLTVIVTLPVSPCSLISLASYIGSLKFCYSIHAYLVSLFFDELDRFVIVKWTFGDMLFSEVYFVCIATLALFWVVLVLFLFLFENFLPICI